MGDIAMNPHLIYGQQYGQHGLNISSASAQYPGYDSTGVPISGKWPGHQGFSEVDCQFIPYSDMPVDASSCVYYDPNYVAYVQPSYSQYPIDSSVSGGASSGGLQQYIIDPAYYQSSHANMYSSPVPTSGTDNILFGMESQSYPNPHLFPSYAGNDAVKATVPLAPSPVPAPSRWAVMPITPSINSPLYIEQFVEPVKPAKTVMTNSPSVKVPLPGPNLPHITQACNTFGYIKPTEHFTREVISSANHAPKSNLASRNGFTSIKSDLHRMITAKNFIPSSKSNDVNSLFGRPNLTSEQIPVSVGSGIKSMLAQTITCKAYTSRLHINDPERHIKISTEQYNRADFPLDYSCAKFFVIKSYCGDDVHKSIKYNVWSSTPSGNKKLNTAYEEAQQLSLGSSVACPVFLLFSVNGSGHFCGVAEMVGPVDFQKDMDFWHQDKWSGSFPVKWHIVKNVPNSALRQFILENNEFLPVTYSRDTQEVYLVPGIQILQVFKNSTVKESMFDDFMKYEELERAMVNGRSKLRYNAPAFVPTHGRQRAVLGPHQLSDDKTRADGFQSQTINLAEKMQDGGKALSLQSTGENCPVNPPNKCHGEADEKQIGPHCADSGVQAEEPADAQQLCSRKVSSNAAEKRVSCSDTGHSEKPNDDCPVTAVLKSSGVVGAEGSTGQPTDRASSPVPTISPDNAAPDGDDNNGTVRRTDVQDHVGAVVDSINHSPPDTVTIGSMSVRVKTGE